MKNLEMIEIEAEKIMDDIDDFLDIYEDKLSEECFKDLKKVLYDFNKFEIFYFLEIKLIFLYKYLLQYIYCKNTDGIKGLIHYYSSFIKLEEMNKRFEDFISNEDNIKYIVEKAKYLLDMEYDPKILHLPSVEDINDKDNELYIFNILNEEKLQSLLDKYSKK